MKPEDLEHFRQLLLAQRRKLLDRVSVRLNELRSGGDVVDRWDYAELATDTWDKNMTAQLCQVEQEELREIDAALERIQAGTYGICQGTGKPISRKRLEVLPTARYCREYQEELERTGSTGRSVTNESSDGVQPWNRTM